MRKHPLFLAYHQTKRGNQQQKTEVFPVQAQHSACATACYFQEIFCISSPDMNSGVINSTSKMFTWLFFKLHLQLSRGKKQPTKAPNKEHTNKQMQLLGICNRALLDLPCCEFTVTKTHELSKMTQESICLIS